MKNPQITALLDKAEATQDHAERRKLYIDAQLQLIEMYPALWLYAVNQIDGVSNKLKRLQAVVHRPTLPDQAGLGRLERGERHVRCPSLDVLVARRLQDRSRITTAGAWRVAAGAPAPRVHRAPRPCRHHEPAAPAPTAAPAAAATTAPAKPADAAKPTEAAKPAAAADAPAATSVPAAAAKPSGVQGGKIVIGQEADPVSLDVSKVPNFSSVQAIEHIYESLVTFDENMKVQPALAESWEIPDPTTYVFHLRTGVKWHNGREFVASDVAYWYQRMMDPATGRALQE